MQLKAPPGGLRVPARPRLVRKGRGAIAAAVAVGLLLVPASSAFAVDRTATTSTFASVFAAAQAGDRILLASGNYGTWSGGSKSGMVTITEQSGATATIYPSMTNATNLTFDGLTITGAYLNGAQRTCRSSTTGSRT